MTQNSQSRRQVFKYLVAGSALPLLSACGSESTAQTRLSIYDPITTVPTAEGQPMPSGVSLPNNPPATKTENSLGFAVIGLGGYALRNMMPSFAACKRAYISALVSGNREKCLKVGEAYGISEDACYGYSNFDDIAQDDRIEAVYIAMPSGLHKEFAVRAFAAGKHVLCEKPMALSSEDCQAMIDAAKAADRKLMIAYRCHFEPHNLSAMELMQQKAVGDIRMIRTNHHYVTGSSTPKKNWRLAKALAGYGPLEDYGIYGLQQALYLSGEMPTEISAYMYQPQSDPRFAEIAAMVGTLMRFPSGALAELSTSYDTRSSNRGVVWGNRGKLTMDPATGYGGHNYVLESDKIQKLNPGDPSIQFSAQMDHLADAVQNGATIKTPGEMGLRDLRLIEAIGASAKRGQSVKLNPDGTMRN